MRTFPFDTTAARGIQTLISIFLRDGTVVRVTTAESDKTDGVNLWTATLSANITQLSYTADGTPAGADIRLGFESLGTIRPGQATRGELDGLPIKIEFFDVNNIGAGKFEMIPGSSIGSAQEDANGVVILAVEGPLAKARKPMAESYTLTCKAKLGDHRCKVPLDVNFVQRNTAYVRTDVASGITSPNQSWVRVDSPAFRNLVFECTTAGSTDGSHDPTTYPTSPGSAVTDGSCVFTCQAARMVQAIGAALDFFNILLTALPDPEPTPLGNIIPRNGPMTGVKIPIRAFDNVTNVITMFEPYSPTNFPAGTDFDVHPGCDKIIFTCIDTFDNIKNMRATPYAPGADVATGRV